MMSHMISGGLLIGGILLAFAGSVSFSRLMGTAASHDIRSLGTAFAVAAGAVAASLSFWRHDEDYMLMTVVGLHMVSLISAVVAVALSLRIPRDMKRKPYLFLGASASVFLGAMAFTKYMAFMDTVVSMTLLSTASLFGAFSCRPPKPKAAPRSAGTYAFGVAGIVLMATGAMVAAWGAMGMGGSMFGGHPYQMVMSALFATAVFIPCIPLLVTLCRRDGALAGAEMMLALCAACGVYVSIAFAFFPLVEYA